ncbi:hypothetical protein ACSBR1_035357 [Camellia fascicularis]
MAHAIFRKRLSTFKWSAYECFICHKSFPTGQALDGHKRCHYNGGNNNSTTIANSGAGSGVTSSEGANSSHVHREFDLNLPALPEFLTMSVLMNSVNAILSVFGWVSSWYRHIVI